jgi:hypothetical protein
MWQTLMKVPIMEEQFAVLRVEGSERPYVSQWLGRLCVVNLAVMLFLNVVVLGMVWAGIVNTRTNFFSNDVAYDKENKVFIPVGVVDWLPTSQFAIVDMTPAIQDDVTLNLDIDKDAWLEYKVHGKYAATVSPENWKRYVSAVVDAGSAESQFNLSSEMKYLLATKIDWSPAEVPKCEVTPEWMTAVVKKQLADTGLDLTFSLDLTSIEHVLGN